MKWLTMNIKGFKIQWFRDICVSQIFGIQRTLLHLTFTP